MEQESIEGTLVESKIDLLIRQKAAGSIKTQLYKPREASANNKNLFRFTPDQLEWITSELSELLDFFEYNTGDSTNFFPQVEIKECPKFATVNKTSKRNALNGDNQSMQINGDVNIRSKEHSPACDIPEGQSDRGLPNFNHLIHKASVKDNFTSKI